MMIDDKKIEELLSERASYSSRIARTWTEQFEDEDTGEIVNTERYEIESIEPTLSSINESKRLNTISLNTARNSLTKCC